jgi:hypothetical protein
VAALKDAEDSSSNIVEMLTDHQETTREELSTIALNKQTLMQKIGVQFREKKGENGSTFCVIQSISSHK